MQNSNIIHLQCPSCMGSVIRNGDGSATCEYCGATFMLQDQGEDVNSKESPNESKSQALSTPVCLSKFFYDCCDRFDDSPMDWWAGDGLDSRGAQKRLGMIDRIGVPNGTTVFLLLDTTIMGSMKIGLACTPEGIYYCDEDKKKGLITWDDFPNCNVREKGGNLAINKCKFIMNTPDVESLNEVLNDLQERIRNNGYEI